MKYTKLFKPFNGDKNTKCYVQIHSNHYDCSFEHIQAMVTELRKDFSVDDKHIQVQKYGGQRIKGITFIEVSLPNDTKIPVGYEEVNSFEFIL